MYIPDINSESAKLAKAKKKKRVSQEYDVIFGVFIILIIFIVIQTVTSALREKDAIYEKMISERKKLMQFSSQILISSNSHFYSSLKKIIILNLANSDDIIFCRLVKPNGTIYLSSIEEEIGEQINNDAIKTKETIILKDKWNNNEIDIMVTPTYEDYEYDFVQYYTLWLGYDHGTMNTAIKQMIYSQIIISIVLVIICILAYIILVRLNRWMQIDE